MSRSPYFGTSRKVKMDSGILSNSFVVKVKKNPSKSQDFDGFLVRVGRLELPASCSQSKRATNCATPGYGIFQLWSNMWSTPIFDQLPAVGEVLSAQVSQGFPGFPRAVARTRDSRSQITRAANYATFGHRYFSRPGAFFPTYVRQYTLRSAALALWHHLLLDRGQHDGFILYLSILPVSPPKSSLFASGRYVGKAVRRLWGLRTA